MFFKRLKCLMFGHVTLYLNTLNNKPLITILDGFGRRLIDIEMCSECDAVYWKKGF